ncbi:MAG: tRNA (adenosine(37)-N6)-dimethylallyltransferase MiaA [Flavobacteriales bacterium]|nr:MAG: tRNA (adenosine(37)-N6)-dimethylallyltransferase MiaA [Flavobacteriales bacterium]
MKILLSIIGTTGIGKTKLAIDLARHFGCEIVSCDSRQFFKEIPIGTAAPDETELSQAKHHFIGNLSVKDYYSIGQYEVDALNLLERLFKKNDVAILVGGSMMYEKAVIEGLNDLPETNTENQQRLNAILEEEGLEGLHSILKELDWAYFEKVDKGNPRRFLRAIDVIWQTGKTYTELINQPKKERDFKVIRIGLKADRAIIYDRINRRVEKMMEKGLLNEVKSMVEYKDLVPLKTVGYTELFNYLEGKWDLDFAISEIQKNSRRFAKRQLTWYRKENNIHWVDFENSLKETLSLLEEKYNIKQ